MRKIAATLSFVFSIQASTLAFAQDGARADIANIKSCMKVKTDEWTVLSKNADVKFEPTYENRLRFTKSVVEIFERMYAVDRKGTLFVGVPVSLICSGALFYLETFKSKVYRSIRAKYIDHKRSAQGLKNLVKGLHEELLVEEAALANPPKVLPPTVDIDQYIVERTNQISFLRQKLSERIPSAFRAKASAKNFGEMVKGSNVAAVIGALMIGAIIFTGAYVIGEIVSYRNTWATIDNIQAANTENDIFNYLEESDEWNTKHFRNFFADKCDQLSTKELFDLTQLFGKVPQAQVSEAIKKLRTSKDLGLVVF